MEMMVVLLIVAIIAAATAPMVSKKMARNAGSGDSPWVFTGLNNSIAYNMNGDENSSVIIGASAVNRSNGQAMPKLYIETSGNEPQLGFGSRGNEGYISLLFDRNNRRVGFSDTDNIPSNSVFIGTSQRNDSNGGGSIAIGTQTYVHENTDNAVAIGTNAHVEGQYSIAIGTQTAARANEGGAIAIGANETYVYGKDSIGIGLAAGTKSAAAGSIALGAISAAYAEQAVAIGYNSVASGEAGIAIGNGARAGEYVSPNSYPHSIAIGDGAQAKHSNSVAIGYQVETSDSNQIVLGDSSSTVYIPGNLKVDGDVELAMNSSKSVKIRFGNNVIKVKGAGVPGINFTFRGDLSESTLKSDRRLKNVGEKYTAGLSELKQLDFFHYTFKKDESKTPHVGVMAQDLQKVFPDAVTKDEDGYLRIRFEDMFYAVINAVKELDNKITEIVNNITQINAIDKKQNETIESMQATIDSQQKTIELLQKDNEELKSQKEIIAEQQKLIKKLEKRIEKLES